MYHPQDIKELVEYAKIRGVRILPEFDAPAHVGNGWQFGPQESEYLVLHFLALFFNCFVTYETI